MNKNTSKNKKTVVMDIILKETDKDFGLGVGVLYRQEATFDLDGYDEYEIIRGILAAEETFLKKYIKVRTTEKPIVEKEVA